MASVILIQGNNPSVGDAQHQSWELQRIRAEYQEMPGLCLTSKQAAKLFALRAEECASLLDALVASGVLDRTRTGYISRRDRVTSAP